MFWTDFFAGASAILTFLLVTLVYIIKILRETSRKENIDAPNIRLAEFIKMDEGRFAGEFDGSVA